MQRCDNCLDLLDEDDEEFLTPVQWLVDKIAMPALVVAFTALCCALASSLIWACVAIWRAILTA